MTNKKHQPKPSEVQELIKELKKDYKQGFYKVRLVHFLDLANALEEDRQADLEKIWEAIQILDQKGLLKK